MTDFADDLMLLKAEPEAPQEGDTYYDARRHKLRSFDGSMWHDLW